MPPELPDPSRTGPAARPRLSYAALAGVAAVGTRLAVVVAVGLWARYLSYPGHGAILRSGLIRGFLVAPLKGKDAMWFTAIAQHGYGPNLYRTAFFPLYPLMLRAVGVLLGHDYWVAGIVVSLACYAGAMFVLYRLTAEECDARTGAITVVLISVFPTAFVFNFIYSESLFLLLGVLAFYCARHEKWAIAGVAGFLAVLTRSTGVALFLPLLVMFAKQRNWTWRTINLRWPGDAQAGWMLLIPAGLVAYMGYLWARFGDPLLFSKAEREYWHRSLHWPWVDVWRTGEAAFRTIREMITHSSGLPGGLVPGHHLEILLAHNVLPFVALVFALCCLVVVFWRLPFAYGLFALLSLLLPLLEPSDGHPLYSFHRFTLVIYPLFMALAIVLRKRPVLLWTWVGASFVLMLYLAGTAVIGAGGV